MTTGTTFIGWLDQQIASAELSERMYQGKCRTKGLSDADDVHWKLARERRETLQEVRAKLVGMLKGATA